MPLPDIGSTDPSDRILFRISLDTKRDKCSKIFDLRYRLRARARARASHAGTSTCISECAQDSRQKTSPRSFDSPVSRGGEGGGRGEGPVKRRESSAGGGRVSFFSLLSRDPEIMGLRIPGFPLRSPPPLPPSPDPGVSRVSRGLTRVFVDPLPVTCRIPLSAFGFT